MWLYLDEIIKSKQSRAGDASTRRVTLLNVECWNSNFVDFKSTFHELPPASSMWRKFGHTCPDFRNAHLVVTLVVSSPPGCHASQAQRMPPRKPNDCRLASPTTATLQAQRPPYRGRPQPTDRIAHFDNKTTNTFDPSLSKHHGAGKHSSPNVLNPFTPELRCRPLLAPSP